MGMKLYSFATQNIVYFMCMNTVDLQMLITLFDFVFAASTFNFFSGKTNKSFFLNMNEEKTGKEVKVI